MRWKLSALLLAVTVFVQARPAESFTVQSTGPKTAAIRSKPSDANQQEDRASVEEQMQRPGLPPPGSRLAPNGVTMPPANVHQCAIPLIKVLTKEAARMDEKMVVPLPPKDGRRQFTMTEIKPPAPSCEDLER